MSTGSPAGSRPTSSATARADASSPTGTSTGGSASIPASSTPGTAPSISSTRPRTRSKWRSTTASATSSASSPTWCSTTSPVPTSRAQVRRISPSMATAATASPERAGDHRHGDGRGLAVAHHVWAATGSTIPQFKKSSVTCATASSSVGSSSSATGAWSLTRTSIRLQKISMDSSSGSSGGGTPARRLARCRRRHEVDRLSRRHQYPGTEDRPAAHPPPGSPLRRSRPARDRHRLRRAPRLRAGEA